MNPRIDNLDDNYLLAKITDWQRQLTEFKNRQLVSGAYNILTYTNQNSVPFDVVDTFTGLGTHRYEVTFVSDTQDYAFATPFVTFYVDTIDANGILPGNGSLSGNGNAYFNGNAITSDPASKTTQKFTFDINMANFGTSTLYGKFYISSTDTGIVSVRRVF